jgi:UDP-N-acetylglucosamine 4,6-dehydratase
MSFEKQNILITGGTGSLGQKLAERFLRLPVNKVIIFSRGEYNQVKMRRELNDERLRFFIGDVRDKERLYRAFSGVDVIVHCAALKHIDVGEYNPFEFVQTNIIGSKNVIDAAIDCKVKKVIAISTDKSVDPSSTYGSTKLCSEKLFIDAKVYSQKTKFSVIRFGNFENSSGSIFEYFQDLKDKGEKTLPITDFRMLRYYITIEKGVTRILEALTIMEGGEIFIPLMEEIKIVDIAKKIHPKAKLIEVGIRPGEKLREKLYNEVEERNLTLIKNFYVVYS